MPDPNFATAPPRPCPPAARWVFGALIVLGIFLRFHHLDHKPLWDDEVVTWLHVLGVSEAEAVTQAAHFRHAAELHALLHPGAALRPVSAVMGPMLHEDPQHPPAFYLLAHGWVSVFGDSLASVRGLAATIGVLTIPLMAWVCCLLFGGATAAWAGAALVALAPVDVLYSQEAREYSAWLACVLLTTALYVRALRSGAARDWAWYALALVLGLYVFPLTAFVAGAHGLATLLVRTPARNKASGVAAAAVAFVLFAPWLLVIVKNLSVIAASMPGIVGADTTRLQTLMKAVNLVRTDVIDFNAAHRGVVLAATLPTLALLAYAVLDLRRTAPSDARIVVWALLACAAGPLIALDLWHGGHRTETTRYFTPMFLALDLALAALIARILGGGVREARGRSAWLAAVAALFVLRIGSCLASAEAPTWWNSYNIESREIALGINRARDPLLVSDSYVLWPLMLGEYLAPEVEVALAPRCYQCTLPPPDPAALPALGRGSGPHDVFLLAPSSTLRALWEAPADARPVACIDVRNSCPGGIEMWRVGG